MSMSRDDCGPLLHSFCHQAVADKASDALQLGKQLGVGASSTNLQALLMAYLLQTLTNAQLTFNCTKTDDTLLSIIVACDLSLCALSKMRSAISKSHVADEKKKEERKKNPGKI